MLRPSAAVCATIFFKFQNLYLLQMQEQECSRPRHIPLMQTKSEKNSNFSCDSFARHSFISNIFSHHFWKCRRKNVTSHNKFLQVEYYYSSFAADAGARLWEKIQNSFHTNWVLKKSTLIANLVHAIYCPCMDYPCISRPSRRNNLSKIFINFLCHGASILPQSLLANPGAMRDCACILTQSFDRNDVLAAGKGKVAPCT
jgi:hypothetical protein